ncbi:MAG: hypothetical protein HY683_09335 [Chloroflexi bacterium]|nr:hypothetical protein [Chloroflexota bacterium]
MRGLKVCLGIAFIIALIGGVGGLILPGQMADANMGPAEAAWGRWYAVMGLTLALAAWYALRDPVKNLTIVRVVVFFLALDALVGLVNAITGDVGWGLVLPVLIVNGLLAAATAYFYPRGQKAT